MRYVSIDIETTGLNAETDNILEIGAIIENTKNKLDRPQCSQFHVYLDNEQVSGNLFALTMNTGIMKKILELKKDEKNLLLVKPENVAELFKRFVGAHGIEKVVFAGKNVLGFDLPFLRKLPNWSSVKHHYRVLDPAILFTKFTEDDVPPDLKTCKQRAGLSEEVSHEALDDAWDVIKLLRTQY